MCCVCVFGEDHGVPRTLPIKFARKLVQYKRSGKENSVPTAAGSVIFKSHVLLAILRVDIIFLVSDTYPAESGPCVRLSIISETPSSVGQNSWSDVSHL